MLSSIFNIVILIASLALLVFSSKHFAKASEKIGNAFGVPQFLIGAILVAVGTSAPELFTSIFAAINNVGTVVSANVVGSNIANILLGIGFAGLVASHITFNKEENASDLHFLIATTAILVMTLADGEFTKIEALAMFLSYFMYIVHCFKSQGVFASIYSKIKSYSAFDKNILLVFALSLGAILVSAHFTIESLLNISEQIGLAPAAISATIVAIGTSLPEIAVAISAARAKNYGLALGDIVGSNIFNSTMVMAIPSLFGTLTVHSTILSFGLPMLIISTGLLTFSVLTEKISSKESSLYIILFMLFAGKLFTN